jgi:predicted outer membrane repeat protein
MRLQHLVTLLVLLTALLAVLLTLAAPAAPAHAGGVVSVCDEAHLLAALAGGGTVTFSCSGTITLTAEIVIAADTTIDGSGQTMTISGNHAVRVFTVNSGVALNLNRLTVANGNTNDFGGGILNNGTLNVSNSTFSDNSATHYGGGIHSDGTLTANNSTFAGNHASDGGGIANYNGTVTVDNSTFDGNRVMYVGGGIFSFDSVDNSGTLTVSNSTFDGNSASDVHYGRGGGISAEGTTMVSDSTFSGNRAGTGGAIYSYGTTTVSNSTFSGNRADEGGGISAGGTTTVSNSTFSGNNATYDGGGIQNSNGTVTVSNSTFSGNRATDGGGGIYNHEPGWVTVSNSTFSDNSAGYGGGIYDHGGEAAETTLKDTIVANSSTGYNCRGYITDGGGNLSYPDATCPGINSDPKLGLLQDNGGPTQTMALLPGSAALDAAEDAICAAAPVSNLDQRGIFRPQGPHCDIGAFEAILQRAYLPIILR